MEEEFEKWANGFDHDSRDWLDMGNDKVFFAGWQARQAEIGVLQEELELKNARIYELRKGKEKLFKKIASLKKEVLTCRRSVHRVDSNERDSRNPRAS